MNVEQVNALLESIVNVIKTMTFLEPVAGEPQVKTDGNIHGDVAGIISLTGSVAGLLVVSFTEECILKIVSNRLAEEMASINDDVRDAVGEITNMISGDTRKRLQKEGLTITAAIPKVVSGKDHVINHTLRHLSIMIPFYTENGPFDVYLCLNH